VAKGNSGVLACVCGSLPAILLDHPGLLKDLTVIQQDFVCKGLRMVTRDP
jgi:hypothetical protein